MELQHNTVEPAIAPVRAVLLSQVQKHLVHGLITLLKKLIQHILLQKQQLIFICHPEFRVQIQGRKIILDDALAEGVNSGDRCPRQEDDLPLQAANQPPVRLFPVQLRRNSLLQPDANALAHLRCRRPGKGDYQKLIHVPGTLIRFRPEKMAHHTLCQHGSLAGACRRRYKNIFPIQVNRPLLFLCPCHQPSTSCLAA